MKSLQQTIKESIFDKNLASGKEEELVRGWLETYMPFHAKEAIIDTSKNTITVNTIGNNNQITEINIGPANDSNARPFDGFPYKIVNKSGKPMKSIRIYGPVASLDGIPDSIEEIKIDAPSNGRLYSDKIFDDINKTFKSLKSMMFVVPYNGAHWRDLDLSRLKIPVKTLYIGENIGPTTFNPDLNVSTLQIGYNGLCQYNNLPTINRVLSFKYGTLEDISKWIGDMKDKGKSNFSKINISCKDLNEEEKNAVKELLMGNQSSFEGYGNLIKKLKQINAVINEKDVTKDRFGEPLSPGDIVICCSSDPNWPSKLDIYKAPAGSRIRCQEHSQVPPRNIIKVNNPTILKLLK
jgi:hypothetical protein